MSNSQKGIYEYVSRNIPSAVMEPPSKSAATIGTPLPSSSAAPTATPSKQRPLAIPGHINGDNDGTPRSSVASSPPPEDSGTPHANGEPGEDQEMGNTSTQPSYDIEIAERTVPIMNLHGAILLSIDNASNGDERKKRDFLGSIMLIGGGSKTPNLQSYLELQLRAAMPQYPKEILVAPPPRDLDPSVIAWKGGSVFGKLQMTNDSWISPLEYDRLGSRILNYKCMWHW
jgi:actin-related protein 8